MPYPGLSSPFLVVLAVSFSFPCNLPYAKLMPTKNLIISNLFYQFQFSINCMYGSNVDPMGRMFTPWSIMGGGYVPGYHTHHYYNSIDCGDPNDFCYQWNYCMQPNGEGFSSRTCDAMKDEFSWRLKIVNICSFEIELGINFGQHQTVN